MPDQEEVITMAGVKERMAMFKKSSTKSVSAPKSRLRMAPADQNTKTINVASRRAMLDDYSKEQQQGSNSSLKMGSFRSGNNNKRASATSKDTSKNKDAVPEEKDAATEALNSSMNDLNKSGNDSFVKPDTYFEGESSDEEELNDTQTTKKSQKVKDKEEAETRDNLNHLLQQELGDGKKSISWGGARVRYIKAVDKLRPEEYDVPIELDEDKPAAKQHLKKQRQAAAETKGRFTELSDAWVKYDDAAQDKPYSANDEDWAIQHDLDDIEDQVADEWQDFCERVEDTKSTFFDSDDSDDDSDDSDMEMWRQEARKLKEDASALQKRRDKRDEKRKKVMEWQGLELNKKSGKVEVNKKADAASTSNKKVEAKPKSRTKASSQNNSHRNAAPAAVTEVIDTKTEGKDDDGVLDALAKAQAEAQLIMGQASKYFDDPKPSPPPSDESDGSEEEPERPDLDNEVVHDEDDEDDSDNESQEDDAPPSPKDSEPAATSKKAKANVAETTKSTTKKKPAKKKKPAASSKDSADSTAKSSPPAAAKSSPPAKAKPVKRKGEDPWKKTSSVSGFKAWSNAPKEFEEVGTKVSVTVPKKTDCWRKTRHNFIMDNAPFYWHKVTGDFEVLVHVSGTFNTIYDKAGIMIRHDAENWMVSSLEYFNNGLNHSTSVTHDFTDWSLCPLPKETLKEGAWICCKRIGNAYETFYSLNGQKWVQTRQGMFGEEESARVGIFCACPMGTSGFKVEFDLYTCKTIKEGVSLGTFNFH